MHRFFVPEISEAEGEVQVKGEQAHQICHVLRLKPGDHILLVDNTGWEYEVEIAHLSGAMVQAKVIKKNLCATEPAVKITLFQALLKTDKFEFVLQKGVELGVSNFVPFVSERCVIKNPGENRVARWEKIVREAAEQSRRAILPNLHHVLPFKEACELARGKPSILLWEEERRMGLSAFLRSPLFQDSHGINLFVGPEGGFPATEVTYAESSGIVPVGLGCRILRAETAGLAAVSAILYHRGDLG